MLRLRKDRRVTRVAGSLWPILILPLLGFVALWPSLNLSLSGDDYLWLWIIKYKHYDPSFHEKGLLLFLRPLYSIFDLKPMPYYFSSMIMKIMASISIYFLARGISKSYLAGMIASGLFVVSYVGLESTYFALYMYAYAAIILASLFLLFFYESRRKGNLGLYLLSLIFFLSATALIPLRMHGIFIVVLLDLLWLFRKHNFRAFRVVLLRLLPLIAGVYLLHLTGIYGDGISHCLPLILREAFNSSKYLFSQGRFDFLFYPLANLGNVVLPDKPWLGITSLISGSKNIFMILAILAGVLFVCLNFLIMLLSRINRRKFWGITLSGMGWLFILWLVSKFQTPTFSQINTIGSTMAGGLFLILAIGIYLYNRDFNTELSEIILFFALWIVAFFLAPWIRVPYLIYPSFSRYFTFSFVGYCLFVACTISLFVKNKESYLNRGIKYFLLVSLVGVIFFTNLILSRGYLKEQTRLRGVNFSNKIWGQLTAQLPEIKDYALFYFTADDPAALHDAMTFGFGFHIGLLYNKGQKWWPDMPTFPIVVDNFDELTNLVLKNKGWERHGFKRPGFKDQTPKVDLDNVYSFHLEDEKLINTKKETIQRLQSLQRRGIKE